MNRTPLPAAAWTEVMRREVAELNWLAKKGREQETLAVEDPGYPGAIKLPPLGEASYG